MKKLKTDAVITLTQPLEVGLDENQARIRRRYIQEVDLEKEKRKGPEMDEGFKLYSINERIQLKAGEVFYAEPKLLPKGLLSSIEKEESGEVEFDPAKADVKALRAFLKEHKVKIPAKTPEADLRKMAADVLDAVKG